MPSIHLERVFVDLPIYNSRGRSLKSRLLAQAVGGGTADDRDRSVVVIRALNDVTLSLEHGTRVALVGHNGAGKTTLLRVFGGIYPPTAGSVNIAGSVACLTDLNLGMDSEATGYENIMMRGTLLGLTKSDMTVLIPQIEEFTGLGDYLNLPIRTYSQGMLLRLSFGISTAVQPDIILLDEIIGAADQGFVEKARTRLNMFIEQASILVLASHDPHLVRGLCTSAIWLEHGRVRDQGPPEDILARYAASQASPPEIASGG
jgi:ABC-type polysaccharide/polyol phosphate transport system ATPase subunit